MSFEWPLAVVNRWSLFRQKFSPNFFGPDSGRSLLAGGRCSEVAVTTGLTVQSNLCTTATLGTRKSGRLTEVSDKTEIYSGR